LLDDRATAYVSNRPMAYAIPAQSARLGGTAVMRPRKKEWLSIDPVSTGVARTGRDDICGQLVEVCTGTFFLLRRFVFCTL
jgi:hypothetical protein